MPSAIAATTARHGGSGRRPSSTHARRSRGARRAARLGRGRREGGAGARRRDGAAAPRGRGHPAHLRQRRSMRTHSSPICRAAARRTFWSHRMRTNWRGVAAPVEIRLWPKEIGADLSDRAHRPRAASATRAGTVGGARRAAARARAGRGLLRTARIFRLPSTASASRPHRRDLLDDARDAPAEYHDGLTVAKTFALAIDEAAKLHPAAEPLIVHAALLAPEPIPLFLFAEAREKFGEPLASALAGDGLDEAVAALRAFALIDRESIPDERDPAITTDCIRLHRLVREVAAATARGRGAGGCAARAGAGTGGGLSRTILQQSVDLAAGPAARCHRTRHWSATGAAYPERALNYAGAYLRSARRSIGSTRSRPILRPDRCYERALAIREKVLGPEASMRRRRASITSRSCCRTGRPCGGAAALRARAGDPREGARPGASRDGDESQQSCWVVAGPGRPRGARLLHRARAGNHEKVLGPEHSETATESQQLANLLQTQGDLAGGTAATSSARWRSARRCLRPEHP